VINAGPEKSGPAFFFVRFKAQAMGDSPSSCEFRRNPAHFGAEFIPVDVFQP
jgi:hypothetical protein